MRRHLTSLIAIQVSAAALMLARNLLAARLLGAEEFGIAAVFAIVAALVEALTAMGLQQLILRDRQVQSRNSFATLHFVQCCRGFAGALLILLFAIPIARVLHLPQLLLPLCLFAIVPILSGFQNLDAIRAMRHRRFLPFAIVQIGAGAVSLVALVMGTKLFGDHRAMLVALVLHAVAAMLLSHLVAARSFRLSRSGRDLKVSFQFARPILINGVLLAVVLQFEKLIVGHFLGASALGVLALGMTLTIAPAMILSKAQQSYFLPQLSSGRSTYRQICMVSAGLACALSVSALLIARPIGSTLGREFYSLQTLLPLLGILASIRIIRSAAVTIALSQDRAWLPMLGNVPRFLMLPVFLATLAEGMPLTSAIWLIVAAEALGLLTVLWMLKKPSHLTARALKC